MNYSPSANAFFDGTPAPVDSVPVTPALYADCLRCLSFGGSIAPNGGGQPVPTYPAATGLAQAKALALARMTAARDAVTYANFTAGSWTFSADAAAQQRLAIEVANSLIVTLVDKVAYSGVTWTLADGVTNVTLTQAQLLTGHKALAARNNAAWTQWRARVASINAATTIAQADAVTW